MTDIAASGRGSLRRVDVTSAKAQARIRARYRKEKRFKLYGLGALLLTTVFVVVLIADVLNRGLPAFWQYQLVLDVRVDRDAVSAGGKVDAASIRGADYYPLTKAALETAIPGEMSRSAQKQLTRLLSTGAADALRQRLVSDPSLVGQTIRTPLIMSANADLYYKDEGTPITTREMRGTATPSGTSGEITVLTSANDFASELVLIKQRLAKRAERLRAEADRLDLFGGEAVASRVNALRNEATELQKRVDLPKVEETLDDRMPSLLVAINGGLVKIAKISDVSITGDVLLPLQSTDEAKPGTWQLVTYETPESNRKVTDQEVAFLERLEALGKVERTFNWTFLTAGDSREPELAGIRGALVGSALTLIVTLVLCLPIGVMAAIYLEEFARKGRITDLIEVNINNLAAVPSIVFGLLGLAVFLNFFGMPRSAPLVGGITLGLLVLPTIIIAARAALKAVPPSIKEAALGVGASHQQAIFHHVLPLAMPGIMTGTIIGMAHALGETAPLLMIGMIAFIVDIPHGFTDAATVLPVQIYLWSDLPETAFKAKTAAAIIVLLMFLFVMNGTAIWLRKKFERRW
ncbi:MAG: phosphate ABC transporter permease PstA [Hyphomicrobium sp.]|uniref:phosphate ABC transporter permease PstA n=1 Tax=Hyphomicrobium sp. TaxID=82 RepID=UPI001321C9A3|nr:phosphate ABC transporter permease PstA [Hyphomicrobium sp.]KAB2939432.1 MAG: phosphate ABC transporter permease PstA [Hyphomicrobium sp.]MBZ0209620.1 phosphate ABC transporter permease PstA [Hyphomicrobium sp.]MCZ7595797.1 phosphate ABC transporter permease PstA [Hyphomicrobium sp.]